MVQTLAMGSTMSTPASEQFRQGQTQLSRVVKPRV